MVIYARPRNLCDLAQKRQFQMYVDFIYGWLYMGVWRYPTVDTNYFCAILISLA